MHLWKFRSINNKIFFRSAIWLWFIDVTTLCNAKDGKNIVVNDDQEDAIIFGLFIYS